MLSMRHNDAVDSHRENAGSSQKLTFALACARDVRRVEPGPLRSCFWIGESEMPSGPVSLISSLPAPRLVFAR